MRSPQRYLLISVTVILIFIFAYAFFLKLTLNSGDIIVHNNFEVQEWSKDPKSFKQEILLDNIHGKVDNIGNQEEVKESQHLLDYINSPAKIKPYNFSQCRMSSCFDFSRCRINETLRVNIVPSVLERSDETNLTLGESNHIHKSILKIIRESAYYEPDPQKACIFVPEDDTLDRDPLSQSFVADLLNLFHLENQYGMNHLIFNLYSGTWPDYKDNDFAGLNFGAAILAKASNSKSHHRPNFDISLPLFSYLHPYSDNSKTKLKKSRTREEDDSRTFFLTFKGKRYVFGKGSETRNSLYHLNNDRDVIMLTTCRHGKKWREASDGRCSDDEISYDQYDFNDLMRESTFCLTPRGRRLGSFRFLEALSYGCIPVILSDGWIEPFNEIIDWSKTTLKFDENLLLQVPDILRDVDQETIKIMRKNCLDTYDRYFSTTQKIILTTLQIIEKRIQNHLNNR